MDKWGEGGGGGEGLLPCVPLFPNLCTKFIFLSLTFLQIFASTKVSAESQLADLKTCSIVDP